MQNMVVNQFRGHGFGRQSRVGRHLCVRHLRVGIFTYWKFDIGSTCGEFTCGHAFTCGRHLQVKNYVLEAFMCGRQLRVRHLCLGGFWESF